MRSRRVRFAGLVAAALSLSVGYVAYAVTRDGAAAARAGIHVQTGAALAPAAPAQQPAAAEPAVHRALGRASLAAVRPQILFRSMLTDDTFGKLALAPLGGPRNEWRISPLKCDRVYFAGGRGLCLGASSTMTPVSTARIFGPDFSIQHELTLAGLPSRARISPDGRYATTTNFVFGHTYATGSFSTETTLIDLAAGTKIATLEQFAVTNGGQPFENRDFNFWGVTFARDSNRFYATLGSGGQTYLVQGDVRRRTARVLRTNVECPSLSPDGTRLAFKKKIEGTNWRLSVLDLRTMKEHPLAERGSVDDQAEWLDAQHVLYWRLNEIWVVRADGAGLPRRFVPAAASPVVVR
jgi:hypothetical protein